MIRAVIVALALLLLPALSYAAPQRSCPQLGVVASMIRFSDLDVIKEARAREAGRDVKAPGFLDPGWGARIACDMTSIVSLDAEVQIFPRYFTDSREGPFGRGKILFLSGATLGRSWRGIRFFATTRLGTTAFSGFAAIVEIVEFAGGSVIVASDAQSATFLTIDVGAGLLWRPTLRTAIRFDAGDLRIRYRPSPRELNPTYWRNNLVVAAGLSWSF